MNRRIAIIDYGMGNLHSVAKAFEYVGATVRVVDSPDGLHQVGRVVLPGVGAFSHGATELKRRGFWDALLEHSEKGQPLLGICLGMQLLFDSSTEFGLNPGLGVVAGQVVPIEGRTVDGRKRRVPHVGWDSIEKAPGGAKWAGTPLEGMAQRVDVYFVHSYAAVPTNRTIRVADCHYDGFCISAAIQQEHVVGLQFHPEKSGKVGLRILARWVTHG